MMRLAEFIRMHSDLIISEWERFAMTRFPVASTMSLAERRDHVAVMLDAIATDLDSPQTKAEQAARAQGADDDDEDSTTGASSHGKERAIAGFSIAELVSEFRALRASVIRLWSEAHGELDQPKTEELIRFNAAIDQLLAESVRRYSEQSQEALRTTEQSFRTLAESMPQIVWATTAEGLNTYFNQQWMDYTGLTLEQSYGEGWIIPFHPDDRQGAWDAWQQATRHRGTYSLECRLRRADGVYRWWLIRGAPLLGANGEILKWFGTCTDIEHIKIVEQKLKESEKEQQFLAEAGAVLAASLDYEKTLAAVANLVVRDFADWCMVIIQQHEQLRRLKVASKDPSKSEVCAMLEQLPLDRRRAFLVRAVVDTKQPLLVERVTSEYLESFAQTPEYLQALRAVSPRSMMVLPILRQQTVLGVLVFVSSGPRHYGRGDLRLAEALADRAAVAIENARLYNDSVEATQARDHVLGIVAHDLRNPLNAITMAASLLQRSGPEPERRSRAPAETILRTASRMSRLIQDILDVSRMERGHFSVEQRRVPTDHIVADSVEAQKPLAVSASIDLRVDLEPGVSDVWADADRILEVFENLIGNALKYTRPGGRITAGAASRDGEVMFWVNDTGPGISAEELPHLFDRLWQARKTRRAGAGLGLQIVKGIVEAHGGRLWVESKAGVGTTFYFTLPTAQTAGGQLTRAELH
jgi:PAS domain S-box-containing protein